MRDVHVLPIQGAVQVPVGKDTVQQGTNEFENTGCPAILETELRHTRR